MAFWIFMLIVDLIVPIVMIGFGRYAINGGPKNINDIAGYRTKRSKKNKDTWEFAHRYVGKLWFVPGIILLVMTMIGMKLVYGKGIDTVSLMGCVLAGIQCIYLVWTILPTEQALKRTFYEDGTRKDVKTATDKNKEQKSKVHIK